MVSGISFMPGSENPEVGSLTQGLRFWLFKGGFSVSSCTAEWYRSSFGTDFDCSEIASPVLFRWSLGVCDLRVLSSRRLLLRGQA